MSIFFRQTNHPAGTAPSPFPLDHIRPIPRAPFPPRLIQRDHVDRLEQEQIHTLTDPFPTHPSLDTASVKIHV